MMLLTLTMQFIEEIYNTYLHWYQNFIHS